MLLGMEKIDIVLLKKKNKRETELPITQNILFVMTIIMTFFTPF